MANSSLQRAALNLLQARVIEKDEEGRWRFQKDWEEWLTEAQLAQDEDFSHVRQPKAICAPHSPARLRHAAAGGAIPAHTPQAEPKGLPAPIISIILKFYEVKGWAVPGNKDTAFQPHSFAAKSLYAAANKDLKMACAAIADISRYMSKNFPQDWGLNAIARSYPDWEKEQTENDKKEIREG